MLGHWKGSQRDGDGGSIWNLFHSKDTLASDIAESLEQVASVKKAVESSRKLILESLQIKVCFLSSTFEWIIDMGCRYIILYNLFHTNVRPQIQLDGRIVTKDPCFGSWEI